jgi:transcriptional accessory protein Tex/SPT6
MPMIAPVPRELVAEAKWIADQLAETMDPVPETQETSPLVVAITKVLTCLRIDHVEVPFIYRHRMDQYRACLKQSDLWKIQEYNIDWCTQIETKKKLSMTISKLGLDDSWKSYVKEAKDALALKDLHELLQVRYASRYREMREENEETTSRQKVPHKTDQYNYCVVNGVRGITDVECDVGYPKSNTNIRYRS